MTILRPQYLQYATETGDDAKVPWAQDPNNPGSANYIPLTVRSERAKARWWALYGTKVNKRQTHGIF